ncbi:MAG: energy-coupled thiamine transporter ThiT [Clostridia bacterium]|nr:energy-coupled thiamine transporter ThiT [Clostridia bacterium]
MFKFKFNARTLAYLALLTALLMVFSFTPIGTIPIGPLSITLNIIPVAIAAIALGPIGGLIIGSVFGLLSFLQCFSIGVPSGMGAILAGISPVLAFIQRFVPRALDGFLVGLIYRALYKLFKEHDSNLLTTVFGLIVGVILCAAGAAVCVNGANKNADPEAVGHPGTIFIVFGAIAAAIGLAFIVLSIINLKNKKEVKVSKVLFGLVAGGVNAIFGGAICWTAIVQYNSLPRNATGTAIGAAKAEADNSIFFIVLGVALFVFGVITMIRPIIKKEKNKYTEIEPACFIAGFLSAFLNTAFFMSALVLLFGNTEYVRGLVDGRSFLVFVVATVGINAIIEIVLSTYFSGVIGSALYRAKLLPIADKSKNKKLKKV